ncbi:MAG: aldo/keto reductase [Candidatus Aminicenantales bacterium]|jgi:predicted aldo/keto reductase-like oxidoreductase
MPDSRKKLDRREFFSTALAGAGAVAVLGRLGKPAVLRAQTSPPSGVSGPLLTRALGKTGLKLPIVNMGVMNADNPGLIRKAYELGIRHFDTAAGYQRGRNEEMVGRVLEELKARDKSVIATKVGIPPDKRESLPPAELKAAFIRTFEGSLRRLRTDYVDMLYIHDVSRVDDLRRKGFEDALAELKSQKKVRFAGFSTHQNMGPCLDEAVRGGFYEVVLVAFNYALAGNASLRRSLENASAKGIGLIAMKTQCMQSWYRDMTPADQQALYAGSILQTAVLKWVLRHEFIHSAVPGFTTYDELEEDLTVGRDLTLTPGEKKFLSDRNIKLAMAACVRCGACLPTCPAGVDTPALMRAHMYLRYPNVFQAQDTLASLPAGRGLDQCASCGSCQARCRGRIDIGKRIDQLKLHFA